MMPTIPKSLPLVNQVKHLIFLGIRNGPADPDYPFTPLSQGCQIVCKSGPEGRRALSRLGLLPTVGPFGSESRARPSLPLAAFPDSTRQRARPRSLCRRKESVESRTGIGTSTDSSRVRRLPGANCARAASARLFAGGARCARGGERRKLTSERNPKSQVLNPKQIQNSKSEICFWLWRLRFGISVIGICLGFRVWGLEFPGRRLPRTWLARISAGDATRRVR